MKSYCYSDRLQLVGKAWEIRHQMRQWMKEAAPDVKLIDFLKAQPYHPQPPEPQYKQREKSKGPRVLFFPLS